MTTYTMDLGESKTFAFDVQGVTDLTTFNVYIGSKSFDLVDKGNNLFWWQLSPNTAKHFGAHNKISAIIESPTIGVQKIDALFFLDCTPSAMPVNSDATTDIVSVTTIVSVTEAAITVDAVVYDYAKGDDGLTYIPYQAYASDANGTGWSLTPSDALKYSAFIPWLSTNPTPPTSADYAGAKWQRTVGEDGNKTALIRWFEGGINGKSIALVGDSTTVFTYFPTYTYFGAKIIRPFINTITASRSGNVVTMVGASLFQLSDIGGKIYFGSGESAVITGFTNANIITTDTSGTITSTTCYITINETFDGSENTPLKGVTIYHCGDNGQTLQGHLVNGGAYPFDYVMGLNADMYIYGFGINDVRLGDCTEQQLIDRLTQLVQQISTLKPNVSIALRTPNTLLTTDPGNTGYVQPLANAQLYSDIMINAYRAMDGYNSQVVIIDTRKTVWNGDVCTATSPLMSDILHPNAYGQKGVSEAIVSSVGREYPTFSKALSNASYGSNNFSPQSIYPNVLEDTQYFEQIFLGTINGFGAGYIDISWADKLQPLELKLGDIFYQDGVSPFALTAAGTEQGGINGYIRILMTSPVSLTREKRVRLYRQHGFGDPEILRYLAKKDTYPWRVKVQVGNAGNGYIDISCYNSNENINSITALDTLICQGISPLILADSTFTTQSADGSGYVRVLRSGDYTAMAGKYGYIFGANRSVLQASGIPGAPRNGQIWVAADNTLKVRINGVNRTITIT